MYLVTREIDFCYGHRVLSKDSPCRHLHGHNGRATIALESNTLDPRGMVLDFTEIKRVVATWIEENLDHRMVLERTDPAVPLLEQLGEPLYLLDEAPTPEALAGIIYRYTEAQGFPIVECRMEEMPRAGQSAARLQ